MGRVSGPDVAETQRTLRERFGSYLARCSIKTAFILYSSAAVLFAAALSFLIAAATSSLYADATAQQSRYSGAYLYDPQENALLPAISSPWYVGGGLDDATKLQGIESTSGASADADSDADSASSSESDVESVYFERVGADPEYYPSIYLDDLPAGFDMMSIVDMDTDPYLIDDSRDEYPDEPDFEEITFQDIPEYDAAANAARGDIESIRSAIASDGSRNPPHVSYVGYYVYLGDGTWADAYLWASVLAVPAVCVLCFALAARRFYRAKLERPIESMRMAVSRVAEGDLDFTLDVEDGGELGDLGRSFEVMRSELDKANHAMWRAAENRRRANAAFAHDLRTPLTVLSGRAEMLAEFAPSGAIDVAQVAEVARSMQRQTNRLASYVESMRDLDALESFCPNPEEADIEEWFAQEADDACDLARGRGLDCIVSSPRLGTRGVFDAQAVGRVTQNLIGNAIRHADSTVWISCDVHDGMLELRVADDGPGFSEEALVHASEPYWREGEGGTAESPEALREAHFGLGLNISSILCDKLGGSLELENDPKAGAVAFATFSVEYGSETNGRAEGGDFDGASSS